MTAINGAICADLIVLTDVDKSCHYSSIPQTESHDVGILLFSFLVAVLGKDSLVTLRSFVHRFAALVQMPVRRTQASWFN